VSDHNEQRDHSQAQRLSRRVPEDGRKYRSGGDDDHQTDGELSGQDSYQASENDEDSG